MHTHDVSQAAEWSERVTLALARGDQIADEDRQNLARVLRGERPRFRPGAPDDRDSFYRMEDILKITNVSRQTLWRWEKQARFPRRVTLGLRCVGWRKSEVQEWQKDPAAWADAELKRIEGE